MEIGTGETQGVFIDIINETVGQRVGKQVLHEGYPWLQAYAWFGLGPGRRMRLSRA